VKPIYEDLSNDELLSRCLGDFTQNSNENFNATVWAMTKTASGKTILNMQQILPFVISMMYSKWRS